MRSEVALWLLSLLILPPLGDPSWTSAEIRGCNRTVRNSIGWIRWTGRMGRCTVRIRAPLRDPQVIEVKVRRLQVGFLKEARCEGAYFQFSDGPDDPDDEAGRYCGHVTGNTTRLFLRRGPDLTITLSSDAEFASANPVIFSAQFSVLPIRLAVERHRGYYASASAAACPVECTVRDERRACRLTSPGYPGVYPRGIRCRIALESSAGRFRIGGQPEDRFDLMNYADRESCRTENCEDDSLELEREGLDRLRSLARGRNRVGIKDHRPAHGDDDDDDDEDDDDGRPIPMMKGTEGTSGQLTSPSGRRGRPREERAAVRPDGGGRQYHKEELPSAHGTGEPRRHRPGRLRIKSMRSKITRKDQRRVDPSRYLNSDFERRDETVDGAMERRFYERKHSVEKRPSGNVTCDGDYLALLENVNGKILEISRFCGAGRVPRIFSRGKNVILEFLARRDGTATHDGFRLTLQEERAVPEARRANCEFVYRSAADSPRGRESVESPRSWYPPETVCTYKFLGRVTERVSVNMKILRDEFERAIKPETKRNFSLNICPGNEIAVYDGAQVNGSSLPMWSYCDASHRDINNIQVPLMSSGNELLIRYRSAEGSYDGQGFTYAISYRFVKSGGAQNGSARAGVRGKNRSISLRPVDLSVLNLNDTDNDDDDDDDDDGNCNCDGLVNNRMGTFKNWFVVLLVLGVVSFLGAVVTIVALIVKFLRIRSSERKLLQNAKQ